jgi:NAD(P)-dependent dehydrogenase (short-subunit alcohol dehydrogenase family)
LSDRLAGKKALIYGGGTGIGLACAGAMAREGAAVFISGRREGVLREAVEGLKPHGKAGFAPGDATIAADVQRVTAAAVKFMDGLDTILVSAGAVTAAPRSSTRRSRNSSASSIIRCCRPFSPCDMERIT